MKEKVSIITATFNSENEVLHTYYSLLEQTYGNWEWLVTDDCSSDSTLDILSDIAAKDSRVSVFSNNTNYGAAVSRNKSLLSASGDFIAFVDSDDLWKDNKLELQVRFMQDNGVDFSFTAYELIDEQGREKGVKVDACQEGPMGYRDMLKKKATLGCSTVMLRRSKFNDLQMPLLRTGQDYATWLTILKAGHYAYCLNSVLTQYRIRANSISRNKFKKARRQWQIYRNVENINFFSSIYYFCFYAYRAVFRR